MLEKIVSGGQTGVDRAALDFAIKHKIPLIANAVFKKNDRVFLVVETAGTLN
jgi:predicted Rossmann fold nucleotide-binding protein DprA/Smf involved in DNA uptake